MIIIPKERKKNQPQNRINVARTTRAPVVFVISTRVKHQKGEKRKNPLDKKNPCWMKWNEMKYCSLWVSRRWAPEGRWWFARQLWERIQAGASMTLIRSATWIRTDPARIYPPPLLARYLLKWRSGKINASYKNPHFKIFFLVLIIQVPQSGNVNFLFQF